MTEQTSFFDAPRGRLLRERAIEVVEQNADEEFRHGAIELLYSLSRSHRELTSDDLWGQLHLHGIPRPREPRAMGAIMREGVRRGWIQPTDKHILSKRPACHRRPLRVWRSLAPDHS